MGEVNRGWRSRRIGERKRTEGHYGWTVCSGGNLDLSATEGLNYFNWKLFASRGMANEIL